MGKPRGFIEYEPREPRARARSRSGCTTTSRVDVPAAGPEQAQPPGGALHGLRHPVLPHGCPLGNLIPEWNDLVYRGSGRTPGVLASTNNFPEITGRSARRLCEAACTLGIHEARADGHQVDRADGHRSWLQRGLGQAAAPAWQSGLARGRRGLGPGGPSAARSSTGARRARRHGVREGQPHRRPAALRHPRFQARQVAHRRALGALR